MKIKKILLFIFFSYGQITWGHEVIMATSEDLKEFDKMIAQQKSKKSDIQLRNKIKTNVSGNTNGTGTGVGVGDEKNDPRTSQSQSENKPQITPVGEPHHGGKQHHN